MRTFALHKYFKNNIHPNMDQKQRPEGVVVKTTLVFLQVLSSILWFNSQCANVFIGFNFFV
jgi:hypothetical protein